MSWSRDRTDRRATLPSNWRLIRERVLRRDGRQCVWVENGRRCPATRTLEVDHIGDRHDHSEANLRTLCHEHHAAVTARQAAEAQRRERRRIDARFRRTESHPGALRR